MGKVVTGPDGGQFDFTQAKPSSAVNARVFNAEQRLPNVGGVNKNIGKVVKHPYGGLFDFTQAKKASKPSTTMSPQFSNMTGPQ